LPEWLWLSLGVIFCAAGFLLSRWRGIFVIFLLVCLGAIRLQVSEARPSNLQKVLQDRTSIRQEARFVILKKLGTYGHAARLLSLNQAPVHESIIIYSFDDAIPGTTYQAALDLKALYNDPILDIYPSSFAAAAYPLLPPQVDSLQVKTSRILHIRQAMLTRLDQNLGEYAPLAKALLLGETEYKQEQRLLLTRAGIIHLVVVSGLHVFFLYFVLMAVLRLILPFRVAELVFLILIAGFAALNNWSPPVTRAILMIFLSIVAIWLSRPLSNIQNLAASLLIITAVRPTELFSIGLQLSFVAVALIVVTVPRFAKVFDPDTAILTRSGYRILSYTLITVTVGLGIAPLTLYYFGTASLNGILANLLGIPLIALLLPLSLILLILPSGIWMAELLLVSYQALSDIWQYWLEFCAHLPLHLENHWLSLPRTLALAAMVILILLLIKQRFRLALRLAVPVVAIGCWAFVLPLNRQYDIHLFNAGVADCCLIRLPGGINLMIDTGGLQGHRAETNFSLSAGQSHDSWMQRKLLPWLARKGVKDIDYLLLTHLHADHAGGLQALAQNLKIKHLIISDTALKSETWNNLYPNLSLKDTAIISISDTTTIALGSIPLKVVHPDGIWSSSDANDNSIVCRLDYDGVRYLFTGDIETPAEEYLAERYPKELRAEYLKAAHHGSRGSSSDIFLAAVQPREVWVTSNTRNVYGFPHPETMQRLNRFASRIKLTGQGSIRHPLAQKD